MSTATRTVRRIRLSLRSAGLLLTTEEIATPRLPGFELSLARLLSVADRWAQNGAHEVNSVSNTTAEIRSAPLVGVVMGSKSDWETMRHASEILSELGIPHESKVVSAHRTPERLFRYGREAEDRGSRF